MTGGTARVAGGLVHEELARQIIGACAGLQRVHDVLDSGR